MIITFDWDDSEHTILYLGMQQDWDIDVSRRGIEEFKARVLEEPHRVDLIAHALDKTTMNPPAWLLPLGVHGILSAPPNTGVIVIVPDNTKLLALAHAGINILGAHYADRIFTAATLEDARQIIRKARER